MKVRSLRYTPDQLEILNDRTRIRVIVGTRRWGKSTVLVGAHTKVGCDAPGFSLMVNPWQSQSEKFYLQNIRSIPNFEKTFFSKPTKLWPFPKMTFKGTGHEWECRGFERNPDAMLGGQLSLATLDESADFDSDDVMRVILPRTADRRAPVIISGTVTTEASFLWQYYLRGQPGPAKDPNVRSWYFDCEGRTKPGGEPSQEHAPLVFRGDAGAKELAFQRSQVSQWVFDQQFLCKPASDGATAFPFLSDCLMPDDAKDADGKPLFPRGPVEGRRYMACLDIGRDVNQSFIVVIDDRGVVVDAEDFPLGWRHEDYARRAAAKARYWNATLRADATGAGGSGGQRSAKDSYILVYKAEFPMLKEFFFSGSSTEQSKYELVTSLMLMFEQKKILISRRFKILIEQLMNYAAIVKPAGTTFGPRHGQDDGVSAVLMAAWGFKRGWVLRGMSSELFGQP